MQLTFKDEKFILDSKLKTGENRSQYPIDHNDWHFISGNKYSTTSLKAAAKFRVHSDELAEKIFDKAFAKHYDTPSLPPLSFLDPHQRKGIEWTLSRSRSYLAHAPGAGKTCQAIIASCLIPLPGPTLFIVPPTLTLNWKRECARFTQMIGYYPTITVVGLSFCQSIVDWNADIIIVPDSMLTKAWVYKNLLKLKPKFIAVDEASRFKEPLSQRSKAFYGGKHDNVIYPGLYHGAHHCVFLDGSPMPNRPMELWAPAYALDPEAIDYLNYFDFGFRYCGAQQNRYTKDWEFKGSSNEDELKTKLQKNFMHVVLESELKHPERLRSILPVSQDLHLPKMQAWQISSFKSISEDKSQGALAKGRKEIGLKKVPWVAQYVRERLTTKNESILLFAWHREVCEELAQRLSTFKPFVVYGGVSNEKREEAFKSFQRGARRLIIGNISAMGRGHNLQKADRVIFAEYSWTDELNKQCEKRSSRRGNDKAFVRCEYIVAPDSIDEIILKSVFTKEKRVKRVIG